MDDPKVTIKIDTPAFLEHLTKYYKLTDDEIIQMCTSESGNTDAEQALSLMMERDFCKDVVDGVLNEFREKDGI